MVSQIGQNLVLSIANLRQAILWSFILCICIGARAQSSAKDYIVAVRRTGIIEFIDSVSLATIGSIDTNVAHGSTGLNGVSGNPDGRTIYIEGPIGTNSHEAHNCCWLYSIDIPTLRTRVVAGIWGTESRLHFVRTGASLMQPASDAAVNATGLFAGDKWQASPDGLWWFGLRNGPAVDLFDVRQAKVTRSFAAPVLNESGFASGVWLRNQFYIYASRNGTGRLWHVSPDNDELGEGVALPEVEQTSGCQTERLINLATAGDRLVVYEIFGGKLDRRDRCDGIRGGAWVLDPDTSRIVLQIAPHLHFWQLAPSRTGAELYGITSLVPGTQSAAELVRVDARTGRVLQLRPLESDYWWLTVTALQSIPSGDVSLTLPDNQ